MTQLTKTRFLFILSVVALTGGCASTGYFADRAHDLGDVATFTLGDGIGARAVVGPLYVNSLIHFQEDRIGWQNGGPILLGDENVNRDHGSWFGFGQEWRHFSALQKERKKDYEMGIADKIPFFMRFEDGRAVSRLTQLEVAAAVVLGVRVGVNPPELLDFILGWVSIDITKDDLGNTDKDDCAGGETIKGQGPR